MNSQLDTVYSLQFASGSSYYQLTSSKCDKYDKYVK